MLREITAALKRWGFKEKKDQDYQRLGIEKVFQRGKKRLELYKMDWGYSLNYFHPNGEVISIVDQSDLENLQEKIN